MSRIRVSIQGDHWVRRDGAVARGRALEDGEPLRAAGIASRAAGVESPEALSDLLERLHGFYGVIVETDRGVLAATDRCRTVPIFYGGESTVVVSDDAHEVRSVVGDGGFDEVVVEEYLRTSCATGRDTLSPAVNQLRPGELLTVDSTGRGRPTVECRRHYRYRPDAPADGSVETYERRYADALERAGARLLAIADGRTIALSLSAGHDSRLLALLLCRLGYDDVIAFTYAASRREVDRAEAVAERLGFDWSFVSLSHEEIERWYRSEAHAAYTRSVGYLDAAPNHWVPLVVRTLRERGAIPDDAVIVTGDGAQTMGEHVPPSFLDAGSVPGERLVEALWTSNYSEHELTDEGAADRLRERLAAAVDSRIPTGDERLAPREAVRLFEEWDWQERQGKRIGSGYVYDEAGLDWWMPLHDDAVLDFWASTPAPLRVDKRLHRRYVERRDAEAIDRDGQSVSFTASPVLLQFLERTVGAIPVVGDVARAVHARLNPETFPYEDAPRHGMVSPETYDRLTDGGRRTFPDELFHALALTGRLDELSSAVSTDPGPAPCPETSRPDREADYV